MVLDTLEELLPTNELLEGSEFDDIFEELEGLEDEGFDDTGLEDTDELDGLLEELAGFEKSSSEDVKELSSEEVSVGDLSGEASDEDGGVLSEGAEVSLLESFVVLPPQEQRDKTMAKIRIMLKTFFIKIPPIICDTRLKILLCFKNYCVNTISLNCTIIIVLKHRNMYTYII